MNLNKENILVTGGCGFIGSHLVDELIKVGAFVVVIDNLSSGSISNLNPNAIFHQGDVSDEFFVRRIFEKYKFDYVIHESTTINTNTLNEVPLHDVKSSINSTIILADNCVRCKVKNFIFASSVAVYGRPKFLPTNEKSIESPIYSYGISKYTAELYVKFFHDHYNLNYQILRYANVYGPRQPIYGEVGVIAIFTDRALKGKDLIIFGNGEHQRDYIFISDVVNFTLSSLKFKYSGIYNIGRGIPITVNEIFKELKLLFPSINKALHKPERYGEIGNFYCDVNLAESTGWRSKIDLKEGINKTIKFFNK